MCDKPVLLERELDINKTFVYKKTPGHLFKLESIHTLYYYCMLRFVVYT